MLKESNPPPNTSDPNINMEDKLHSKDAYNNGSLTDSSVKITFEMKDHNAFYKYFSRAAIVNIEGDTKAKHAHNKDSLLSSMVNNGMT